MTRNNAMGLNTLYRIWWKKVFFYENLCFESKRKKKCIWALVDYTRISLINEQFGGASLKLSLRSNSIF